LVSLAISTNWLEYHFTVVQFSEIIAFFYVLGWVFLRRGRDTLGGVCLGLAATIKFFPAVMIGMLFFGKRWRVPGCIRDLHHHRGHHDLPFRHR